MKQFKMILSIYSIVVATTLLLTVIFFFQRSFPYLKIEFSMLYDQCKTCEIAKELAIKDFNHKKFNVVYWGLESYPTDRGTILQNKFKIKLIHGGCVPISKIDCYKNKMVELLYAKYGEKLFPL